MNNNQILNIKRLNSRWETSDPFLFCVHHHDQFPKGNNELGPNAPLTGRNIGSDFDDQDGWNMYHGKRIPGFPEHPHRGFETVTTVLEGYIDHFDNTGSTGRFGAGDVQWMTAGHGARHSEMFPLINQEEKNPTELFQIWLNLPRKSKFVDPHYKMLWREDIPVIKNKDQNNNISKIRLIAGSHNGINSLAPSPNSWAQDPDHNVRIMIITMDPEATLDLSPVSDTLNRTLYFYNGDKITIDDRIIHHSHSIKLHGNKTIQVKNGAETGYFLLLEGEPIGEPVVNRGPFVMTTHDEIQDAYNEYQDTGFGGWPWERPDPVHPREKGRFAKYSDGTVEERDSND